MHHKRLLFVDDEPVIRELYASLGSTLGHGHEIYTAAGGEEALKLLTAKPFDVVVSDLAMPEMDGIEFLNEVVRGFPESARIVISGFADRLKVAECLTIGHRFFNKPLNFNSLAELLKRICQYSYLISSDRVRRIVCGGGALPTPPETYLRLTDALSSPFTDLDDIGAIVEQDPGLTTKLLHIVNSAQFGISRRVVTPVEAVQIVGVDVLRALILGIQAFNFYDDRPFARQAFRDLWAHSLRTAVGARKLAVAEGFPTEKSEECFLAGLLHDVGKLVLAANAEREYSLVLELARKARVSLDQAEKGIFASTHAQIGAYLLALWGVPDSVVQAVEFHHSLEGSAAKGFSPALAIHAAQHLQSAENRVAGLNLEVIRSLGLEERIPVWKELLNDNPSN
jgi:HD-like signal output (HDOD) protein/ActR/RegA family two-component response regulator